MNDNNCNQCHGTPTHMTCSIGSSVTFTTTSWTCVLMFDAFVRI